MHPNFRIGVGLFLLAVPAGRVIAAVDGPASQALFGAGGIIEPATLRARGVELTSRAGQLQIAAGAPAPERSVVFPLPVGGENLAAWRYVEAGITNVGPRPVMFTFWAMSGEGWGGVSTFPTGNPAGRETLAPGERAALRIDLHARYSGRDVSKPAINPAAVRWLEFVFERRSEPLAVEVEAVRVTGAGLPGSPEVGRRILIPEPTGVPPDPGRRVFRQLPDWRTTGVRHVLTLPRNWRAGERYPILVEYTGNQFYHKFCYSTGRTADGKLAVGLARGEDFICLNLPFISADGQREQIDGWGDIDKAVDYCLNALEDVFAHFGGDRRAVIFTGFSRGAYAGNYLALRNDRIASVWSGFLTSFDPGAEWKTPGDGWQKVGIGWNERAERMRGRPWFYVPPQLGPEVHADVEFLEDRPSTRATRKWLADLVAARTRAGASSPP